jgi:hypothetical protein
MSDGPVCSKRVAMQGKGFTVLGKDCRLITGFAMLGLVGAAVVGLRQ